MMSNSRDGFSDDDDKMTVMEMVTQSFYSMESNWVMLVCQQKYKIHEKYENTSLVIVLKY